MRTRARRLGLAILLATAVGAWGPADVSLAQAALAQISQARITEALDNISVLNRKGRVGYATVWEGNRYIQCRRMPQKALRCEAAGATMQPSLISVLTAERLTRLAALGWKLDPSFGNYVQTFAASLPTSRVADRILRTLTEAYGANAAALEVGTAWVADLPCPPRNGPSQNLAGMINDAPSMAAVAVYECSYTPPSQTSQIATSAAELVTVYGPTVTAELQRLRINAAGRVYAAFNAGIGYVQCMPETPTPAFYCEAQSVESWAALAAVLTPDRVARLHKAGYADPGRAPNYWKSYPYATYSDAAVANEILTILFEVYGYTGATRLKIVTEE